MLSINTNLSSLITQNSLKNSTLKLNQAVERMTTGYKVNHAKDNAANYSIATDMTTKIGAYRVAEDNCAMGLDLLNTANESLNLISDKLARLRALSEQAANGTYGKPSLGAINSEANALIDEIERSYSTTKYNGINLFGKTGGTFIKEIACRDTSQMTSLACTDDTTSINSGTYSIATAEELAKLAQMANSGLINGGEFVLANNIDLSKYSSGEGWTPIGTSRHEFTGVFDGNGFIISNLYINRPDDNTLGLFGQASASEIKNLGITNINITAAATCGAIAGAIYNNSNIINCYSDGKINALDSVGGLAGDGTCNVADSYSGVNITGRSYLGGIYGKAEDNSIINCYTTGDIKGEEGNNGSTFIGGIIGGAGSTSSIQNCYSTSNVTGNNYVGGLAGGCSTISNSYHTGNVIGYSYIGALAGGSNLIENSYSIGGDVMLDQSGFILTGNYCQIQNSYFASDTIINGNRHSDYIKWTSADAPTEDLFLTEPLPFIYDYGKAKNTVSYSSNTNLNLQVGINSSDWSQISANTAFACNVSILRGIGIDHYDYINEIDELITNLSAKQTELGAAQNRLESALEEISTKYENLSSSRSTLKDADIAKVSSEYIKQQILQQASATLLATANQSPALALQLL